MSNNVFVPPKALRQKNCPGGDSASMSDAQTLHLFALRDFSYQELLPLSSTLIFPSFLPKCQPPPPPSILEEFPLKAWAHRLVSPLCLRRPAVHQPLVRLQRPSRPADAFRRLPRRVPWPPLPRREGRPVLAPAGTHQQRVQRGEFVLAQQFESLRYFNHGWSRQDDELPCSRQLALSFLI